MKLEAEKELEQLKEQGLVVKKDKPHYLRVLYGIEGIQENQNAVRAIFKFLTMKLLDSSSGELTNRCKEVLKEIHETLQEQDEDMISLPE